MDSLYESLRVMYTHATEGDMNSVREDNKVFTALHTGTELEEKLREAYDIARNTIMYTADVYSGNGMFEEDDLPEILKNLSNALDKIHEYDTNIDPATFIKLE